MRIYRMTATFGKLNHETLTLEPGLNILTAPNEWGKSTWCAFLTAMLYGLDTRTKTTKTALADKERYAPWSGEPMSGRMDLCWNGRDITIERTTKGRIPMGEFRAYETASGLPVPELTSGNCGQVLLGVEQTVFRRAGFIRQAELPVTQDEALRRRLNALVTTGDESGSAEQLAQELKDLKNRVRYNRTGLLPQAQAQRDALQEKLEELTQLEDQLRRLKARQGEQKALSLALENHQAALDAAEAEANAGRIAQAREDRDRAEDHLLTLENICAKLPSQEEAQAKQREVKAFREEWGAIVMEQQNLPRPPLPPAQQPPFVGMDPTAALEMVRQDRTRYQQATHSALSKVLYILGALLFLGAVGMLLTKQYLFTALMAGTAALSLMAALLFQSQQLKEAEKLEKKYGSADPARWTDGLRLYESQLKSFTEAKQAYDQALGDVDVRLMVLGKRKEALCGGQDPDAMVEYWQQVQAKWDALDTARREARQAGSHFEALAAMAKPTKKTVLPDNLTYSREETARLLAESTDELQRLHTRLGQYQGRMEALGTRESLEAQLSALDARIAKLEQTNAALTIALETLSQARSELQRRFAPRISQRAQALLAEMTGGRYTRLSLGEDLELRSGAENEDTLHHILWRSDGTMDQLYLALRLAVAEALTPDAPLILDDALVRFDDQRLAAAVALLRREAEEKQVLLFTCQSREANC